MGHTAYMPMSTSSASAPPVSSANRGRWGSVATIDQEAPAQQGQGQQGQGPAAGPAKALDMVTIITLQ
jgi:hypothetical protein